MSSVYSTVAEEFGLSERIVRNIVLRLDELNAMRQPVQQTESVLFVQLRDYDSPPAKHLELTGEELAGVIAHARDKANESTDGQAD